MPPSKQRVVGEGTFGCVVAPSLECADVKMDYTNKVSKVMHFQDAEDEIYEYQAIDKADPGMKYHVGNPTQCSPAPTNAAKNVIDTCDNFNAKEMDTYELLIMENGGVDLDTFAKSKKHTKESVSRFWKEARNIVLALLMMKRNRLVHHDLKPQNMVFRKQLKMIDFGKMKNQDTLITKCSDSRGSILIHFNYPLELYFLNRDRYMRIANANDAAKRNFVAHLEDKISDKLTYFFTLIKPIPPLWIKNEMKKMVMNDLTAANYDKFVAKSVETTDVYGVGLTFLYMLRRFESYMPSDIVEEMRGLFKFAIHPNVFLRYDPETLLREYDELMNYWHHEPDDFHVSAPQDTPIVSKKDTVVNPENKECPSSHERNPITGRCNKKCGKMSRRNEQFKCVRRPAEKRKPASIRNCPETDERNPITGRCNKKCGKFSRRNEQFKCVRNITSRKK
jgi:serine/threonine protein kinase